MGNNESIEKIEDKLEKILFDNLLDGVALCRIIEDEKGRPADWEYVRVNKTFEPLTGLKDVTGKKVTEIIPGIRDSNPELFEIYGRVASKGGSEEFETELKELGLYLRIWVFSPGKGYFVAVFENITEQKNDEVKIRQSEAKYRNMFENIPVGIFQSTPEGRLLSVNPGFAKIAGYSSAEEMIDKITDLATQLYADPRAREKVIKEIAEKKMLNVKMKNTCNDLKIV